MSRSEAWFHHCANLLVGATGLLYAKFLYLTQPSDEFSAWNHPWQGNVRDAHILLAPLLLLSFGLLWAQHAKPRLRQRTKGWKSGLSLCISFLPMAWSGYAIQIAVDEDWRRFWQWVHVASSLLWLVAFLIHQLKRRRNQPNL